MASTSHPGPLESSWYQGQKICLQDPCYWPAPVPESHDQVGRDSRQVQTWVSSGLALTPEYGSSLAGEKRSRPHINPIKLNVF